MVSSKSNANFEERVINLWMSESLSTNIESRETLSALYEKYKTFSKVKLGCHSCSFKKFSALFRANVEVVYESGKVKYVRNSKIIVLGLYYTEPVTKDWSSLLK